MYESVIKRKNKFFNGDFKTYGIQKCLLVINKCLQNKRGRLLISIFIVM